MVRQLQAGSSVCENQELILQDTEEDQLRILFERDLSPTAPMVMSSPNLLWRK